jgi:hypothetical protein
MAPNAARQIASAAQTEPVADLLRRVAGELRNAARAVDDVYAAADDAEAAAQSVSQHRPLTQALQELDHTYQKIACLADFLSGLAQSTPAQWALDPAPAAEGITLSALAERLRSPDARAIRPDVIDGDLELF